MRLARLPAIIFALTVLCWGGQAFTDTVHMKNGRKLEGRIVEVRETGGTVESIRIDVGGVLVTVPGSDIDRYEDESEPTDTPTPRPTNTPAPTDTARPTNTPLPQPTSTPMPRIVPPTPIPRRPDPAPVDPVPWEEPGGFDQPGEPEQDFSWDIEGEPGDFDFGDGQQMPTAGEILGEILRKGGPAILLLILHEICIIAAWIMCLLDSRDKGWEMMLVVGLFGFPCCSCIAGLVLLGYARTKYDGDWEWVANTLITVALGTAVLLYFLYTRISHMEGGTLDGGSSSNLLDRGCC